MQFDCGDMFGVMIVFECVFVDLVLFQVLVDVCQDVWVVVGMIVLKSGQQVDVECYLCMVLVVCDDDFCVVYLFGCLQVQQQKLCDVVFSLVCLLQFIDCFNDDIDVDLIGYLLYQLKDDFVICCILLQVLFDCKWQNKGMELVCLWCLLVMLQVEVGEQDWLVDIIVCIDDLVQLIVLCSDKWFDWVVDCVSLCFDLVLVVWCYIDVLCVVVLLWFEEGVLLVCMVDILLMIGDNVVVIVMIDSIVVLVQVQDLMVQCIYEGVDNLVWLLFYCVGVQWCLGEMDVVLVIQMQVLWFYDLDVFNMVQYLLFVGWQMLLQ